MEVLHMANPKIDTWIHLYERLGRRQLTNQKILFKDKEKVVALHLVYDENGKEFWFETKELTYESCN
jgi:hypothetical protein